MHIVIVSDSADVAAELVKMTVTYPAVTHLSCVDLPEELFELEEQTPINLIFMYLDGYSERAKVLFTTIYRDFPYLLEKLIVISPLSSNLSKNHLISVCIPYPLKEGIIQSTIDDFYIEEDG